jgi:hypothetical protein
MFTLKAFVEFALGWSAMGLGLLLVLDAIWQKH